MPSEIDDDRIPWATKYRPRRFEDVLGQDAAVEALAGRARRGNLRSVVLSGPSGVGKTTLAEIYANALLCLARTESGSPCLVCAACIEYERGTHENIRRVTANDRTIEYLRYLYDGLRHDPLWPGPRIHLFSEAQRGSQQGFEIFYDELERTPPRVIWILTLINAGRLDRPLLGRTEQFVLSKPAREAGVGYLARICQAEAVVFDQEALELLAWSAPGYRDAIRDLESVAAAGPVTVDQVRKSVLSGRYGWLSRYFDALGGGDLDAALDAFSDHKLDADEQAEVIVQFINFIKLRYVGPTLSSVAKRFSVLTDADCIRIVDFFDGQARRLDSDLRELWTEVMRFWAHLPARLTPAVLQGRAIEFYDLVHGQPALRRPWPAPDQLGGRLGAPPSGPLAGKSGSTHLKRRFRSALSEVERGRYLSALQASDIYEAASFALQVRRAPFNFRVELDWGVQPDISDGDCARWAGDFARQFQARLQEIHRITLNERREDGTLVTTLIGHVPDVWIRKAEEWLDIKKAAPTWPASLCRSEIKPFVNVVASGERHWRFVRGLWRGLDPTVRVDATRALIGVLGVPPRQRRAAGRISCRRYSLSAGIGRQAWRQAAETGLPHLSAFAAESWGDLFGAWHFDEYEFRKKQLDKWAAEMEAFKAGADAETPLKEQRYLKDEKNIKQKQIDEGRRRPVRW